MGTSEPEHLEILEPGKLSVYLGTSGPGPEHLGTSGPGNLNTWAPQNLGTSTPGHLVVSTGLRSHLFPHISLHLQPQIFLERLIAQCVLLLHTTPTLSPVWELPLPPAQNNGPIINLSQKLIL